MLPALRPESQTLREFLEEYFSIKISGSGVTFYTDTLILPKNGRVATVSIDFLDKTVHIGVYGARSSKTYLKVESIEDLLAKLKSVL